MPETPPVIVTPVPSRVDQELAQLEARRVELLAEKQAQDEARDAAPDSVRALAVALHDRLCVADHAALECTWRTDPMAENPAAANWTEPQHRRWLLIAAVGIATQGELGWTVAPPSAP